MQPWTLEAQIAELAKLGLPLAEGVTVDDLLYSFDRSAYESKPFDMILFVLGVEVEREPWGRNFCERAWNFDTECIAGPGSYVSIVENLLRVADSSVLTDVKDEVDLDAGRASLAYQRDGKQVQWPIEVNDDWADMMTVSYVLDHIERDGRHYWSKDNGQAMVLFFVDDDTAARLNELSGGSLTRAVPE